MSPSSGCSTRSSCGSQILREDKGSGKMQEVWGAIRDGADAYLRRQLRSILPLIVVLTVALFFSVYIVPPPPRPWSASPARARRPIRLIIGSAGQRPSSWARSSACRSARSACAWRSRATCGWRRRLARSFGDALRIAYRAGTITGMLTDGLGLSGGTIIFIIFGIAAPDALLGFGFGGTLLALFMRVGGGIFTKAADVGADLVGKVEAGIPEDDPRNPAVIADLVGDNVGDCAGMAADIFESYEVTIVSGLILGLALTAHHRPHGVDHLPAAGARHRRALLDHRHLPGSRRPGQVAATPWRPSSRGFLSSAAISVVLFGAAGLLLHAQRSRRLVAALPGHGRRRAAGHRDRPADRVLHRHARRAGQGDHARPPTPARRPRSSPASRSATSSSVWSILVIAATIFASILIFGTSPGSTAAHGSTYILYGVAMTGIGMLTLTGNNVAMDSFGPISDNANGIGEMAWHGMDDAETKAARQIMADLDAVGNTTKAITKGVAIGSAVIAAVSLFGSFLIDVSRAQASAGHPAGRADSDGRHPR